MEARCRAPSMQQAEQRPVRIFCKEDPNLNITLRGDNLTLQHSDPTDKTQHWLQYFDTFNLKDDEGRRPFALVNRTTGQAMVYRDKKLQLAPYSSEAGVELSMLWSLGHDLGDGFAEVRALKDIYETLNGIHGNVRQGTVIEVFPSRPADANAIWKFEPIPDQSPIDTTAVV